MKFNSVTPFRGSCLHRGVTIPSRIWLASKSLASARKVQRLSNKKCIQWATSPIPEMPAKLLVRRSIESRRASSSAPAAADPQSMKATSVTLDSLSPYEPPKTGLLSLLPSSWVPFAELVRLNSPTGTIYLFFPCLFSTLLAAPLTNPAVSPTTLLSTSALFLIGSLVMRGAGCTINDLWDRNLDPYVARTRLRPIARGAVTPRAAVVYTGAQLLLGLAVLLQFPQPACFLYATPSLLLVATYPLAKRVTHYPQLVLGLTFSWGAIMGFPALGVDLLADAAAAKAAALMYASCNAWTVLYDMIYAHMDLRDDVRAGIKSIAVKHGGNTKAILTGLATVQLGLLAGAGAAVGAGPAFFTLGCGSAAVALGTMIWRVDLKSVESCWWWFRKGVWFTGGAISFGLLVEYLDRRRKRGLKERLVESGATSTNHMAR